MPKLRKKNKIAGVSAFLVRWTNDDLEADLPNRFAKALEKTGRTPSATTRALIRELTEEIERAGGAMIIQRVAKTVAKQSAKK